MQKTLITYTLETVYYIECIFFQTSDEDIGEIYQDEENQAAVLLRTDDGAIIVVSCICRFFL